MFGTENENETEIRSVSSRRWLNLDYSFLGSILRCCIFVFNALHLVDLVMIGLVLRLPKFMVYYGFSPGFIFNFSYLSTRQEIGWEERLRYDLYCVMWDVKPQLNQSVSYISLLLNY